MLRGKLEQEEVTLCNIYAPPGSKIYFFKEVFSLIAPKASGTCICASDYNLPLKPKLDTSSRDQKLIWKNYLKNLARNGTH